MAGESSRGESERGDAGLFAATRWSVVLRARDKSEAALGTLCENYRRPMMVWLRTRGYTSHDAEDLVHGFLAHALQRDFLERVSKEKGMFRTFLLKCLKNYLTDQHDRSVAGKRGGGQVVESLDASTEEGGRAHDPAAPAPSPDAEYDRAWAHTVLANALRRLEEECSAQGRQSLSTELQPVLFADESAASYQAIGDKLGMSEGAVKVAAHRLRTRLNWLIRDEILQTVARVEDLQEEVRYLIQLFAR